MLNNADDDQVELINRNSNIIEADNVSLIRPNDASNIEQLYIKHGKILSYSIKIGIFWIIISVLQWFFFCCRWYVWILYARRLGQHDATILGFSTYSVYFIQAFSNLFWGYIADKYSYDIVGTILAFLIVIGLVMESIATNFTLLLIGTIIVDIFRAHLALGLAFLTKYLPNHYAIKYQTVRLSLIGLSNLLGPVIGGILETVFSIKSPFYFSTIIAFLSFLFLLLIMNGTQTKIHSEQIEMKQLYDKLENAHNSNIYGEEGDDLLNAEYQFPISTKKYIAQQIKERREYNVIPKLTIYEWFMIINVLAAQSCTIAIEGIFATYFVVFGIDLYNISVIKSTLMICTMSFTFIIGCIMVPPLVRKFKNYNMQFISIIIMTIFMLLFVIVSSSYFMDTFNSNWLWILCCITGLAIGTINMFLEVILLDIQPKQHAAKISGAQVFSRMIARAFITFIVGVLWTTDIYWFLYAQIVYYLITLICTVSIMIGFHIK